jgi:hypothetical protein
MKEETGLFKEQESSSPADELRDKLDQICQNHGPSRDFLSIYAYENDHATMVLKEYGRFVSQFELFFDLLNDLIVGVNFIPKSSWPPQRSIQFLLAANNVRFFYNSFDRLIKGFWVESMVLSRPIFEAFIKIVFASCYPAIADAALVPKRSDGKRFNLTGFIRDDLRLDWLTYRLWSTVAHSNTYEVLGDLSSLRAKTPALICMKLGFDKTEFESALNLLMFVAQAHLRAVIGLFVTSFGKELTEDLVQKAQALTDLWGKAMRRHPKEHWPRVMDDLDYVFEIVKASETGQDWKAIASKKQPPKGVDGKRY